ncbi:TPA: SGNH/GDSL hydrolase family protein [Raoultella planticola]
MTQYNTGNAVPSSDTPDAWDNNATIDIFVNSPDLSVTTRTGIERDTMAGIQQKSADQREQIATDGAAVVEETRQNLIPLSRQYMTLEAAQADIANIPEGSTTYYRSPDNNALAIEIINNAGTLEPTGRKMPSQTTVDNLSTDVSTLNERVTDIATQAQANEMLGGIVDKKGRVPLWVNSKGDTILKKDINITQIGEEYPETRENASTALGYGIQETDRKFSGGIVDALGRLMVGFDFKGNMYIKGESLDELIAGSGSNKYINGNALSASAFGNSLTFGAGTGSPPNGWVEQISVLMPEMKFRKFAVGGQVSSEIATRQGGFVNLLTLQGNTIPASGPVNVTAQKYRPITVNSAGAGQANLKGTLFGVHGTLNATYDSSGNMLTNTFTRMTPGDAIYVDPESAFILDSNDSEYDILILCYGRNDVYAADFRERVLSALAASVAHMKYLNKRFIIISIPNRTGSTEIKGTTAYNNIIALNKEIQGLYPESYLDIRAQMVRAYDPAIPQDIIDFGNDCPPSSLMFDETHPNANGYTIWANAIKKFIVDRGWNE